MSRLPATKGAPIDQLPPAGDDIRMVPLSLMKRAPYNPRTISAEGEAALDASMDAFGNLGVIVWNRRTGHIVGGHQRVRREKAKKTKALPTKIVDVDLETEQAMNLALNSAAVGGQWDRPRLEELISAVMANRAELADRLRFGELRETFVPPARTVSFTAAEYKPQWQLVVECKNEKEQKRVHDQLVALGLAVKVLTL